MLPTTVRFRPAPPPVELAPNSRRAAFLFTRLMEALYAVFLASKCHVEPTLVLEIVLSASGLLMDRVLLLAVAVLVPMCARF